MNKKLTIMLAVLLLAVPTLAQWNPDTPPESPNALDEEFSSYPSSKTEFIGTSIAQTFLTGSGQLQVDHDSTSQQGYLMYSTISTQNSFVIDTKVTFGAGVNQQNRIGLLYRETGESGFEVVGLRDNSGTNELVETRANNDGSMPSGALRNNTSAPNAQYIRVYFSGTSATSYWSADGINWSPSLLLSGIDSGSYDVGLAVVHYGNHSSTSYFDFFRVRETTDERSPVYGDGTLSSTPTPTSGGGGGTLPTATPQPTQSSSGFAGIQFPELQSPTPWLSPTPAPTMNAYIDEANDLLATTEAEQPVDYTADGNQIMIDGLPVMPGLSGDDSRKLFSYMKWTTTTGAASVFGPFSTILIPFGFMMFIAFVNLVIFFWEQIIVSIYKTIAWIVERVSSMIG